MEERNRCWMYDRCNHIDCDKFCLKEYRINKIFDNAFISNSQRKYQKLLLDANKSDYDAFVYLHNIETNIEQFVKSGQNLYLCSSTTGNGKTSWSLRLAQEYIHNTWYKTDKNCLVLFISVPKYLLAIKDNITAKSDYITHIKENILEADLVIWDDIGSKAATSFEHENLLSIIDTRINNQKSNIYTSNLVSNELQDLVGDRLYSRIVRNSMPNVVTLVGMDKRDL